LAAEQAIAAKKQAVRDEVLQAEAEATKAEVAEAMAAADAQAEQQADAQAASIGANLTAQDQYEAELATRTADASALAWAQAAGSGDLAAQAAAEAKYKAEHVAKRKRLRAEEEIEEYTKKLRQQLASESDTDHRVRMARMSIEGIWRDLSPSERVLIHASMTERRTDSTDGMKFIDHYGDTMQWDVAAMTVPKLKQALQERGIDQTGLKSVLAARLLAALAADA